MNECSSLLLTHKQQIKLVRQELNRILSVTNSFSDRQALRLLKLTVRSRILDQCMAAGVCTTQDFIRATHVIVEKMFERNHKIRVHSKLIAVNVGVAAATAFLTNGLPREIQAVTTFITVYVSNAAWEFVAPIVEPSLGKLRRKIFSSVRRGHGHEAQTDHNQTWGDIWQATQANLTPPAQWGRATVNGFLAVALQRTYAAHQAMMMYKDPVKARSYAADQVADMMFYLRTAYKDVPASDADITRAMKSSFVDHVDDVQAVATEVWKKIQARDPDVARSSKVAEHYKTTIQSWFGVRL